jgi:hypothetical protein
MTDAVEDYWNSPADLLDAIEMQLCRLVSRESVHEEPEGPVTAVIDVGDIDAIGSVYLRQLRKVLRNAGLDVPQSGEWDKMPEDAWEPLPPRERDPRIAAIMADVRNLARKPQDSVTVPPMTPTTAAAPGVIRETALYRWWDAADLLLYIGISDHLGIRTHSHTTGSSWMEFAVKSAVERYPDRNAALDAEEAAIKTERPLFNHAHNNTPEARQRLVEYLVRRERLDLLAPALSRG